MNLTKITKWAYSYIYIFFFNKPKNSLKTHVSARNRTEKKVDSEKSKSRYEEKVM